jgi:choline dehydrogenase-like flavoprotein
MLIGYGHTSTADQNPDHQGDALLRYGVERDNIHVDVARGAKASRPKLDFVRAVRQGKNACCHAVGTCVMCGGTPTAVVDQMGKVHGVDGLYVVDASIMRTSRRSRPTPP